jgi:hypothetical protein
VASTVSLGKLHGIPSNMILTFFFQSLGPVDLTIGKLILLFEPHVVVILHVLCRLFES